MGLFKFIFSHFHIHGFKYLNALLIHTHACFFSFTFMFLTFLLNRKGSLASANSVLVSFACLESELLGGRKLKSKSL